MFRSYNRPPPQWKCVCARLSTHFSVLLSMASEAGPIPGDVWMRVGATLYWLPATVVAGHIKINDHWHSHSHKWAIWSLHLTHHACFGNVGGSWSTWRKLNYMENNGKIQSARGIQIQNVWTVDRQAHHAPWCPCAEILRPFILYGLWHSC